MFLHADSKYSDQTGQMPRLIWVFTWCADDLLVLSCTDSFFIFFERLVDTYMLYWIVQNNIPTWHEIKKMALNFNWMWLIPPTPLPYWKLVIYLNDWCIQKEKVKFNMEIIRLQAFWYVYLHKLLCITQGLHSISSAFCNTFNTLGNTSFWI